MSDQEAERLNMLQLYRVLDSATEKAFDDLTRLAATICDVPIGLVSLVDKERQWFKSKVGLEAFETPRDQAFCAHAIQNDDVMIVEDAHADARFAENPLVTGDPHIRFYAGAPLTVAQNVRLGTLCVIDRKPRQLTAAQLKALEVLRDAVVTQLELRRAAEDLKMLQNLIPLCAWCRSVETEVDGEKQWVPLYDYVSNLKRVSHGVCPGCLEQM